MSLYFHTHSDTLAPPSNPLTHDPTCYLIAIEHVLNLYTKSQNIRTINIYIPVNVDTVLTPDWHHHHCESSFQNCIQTLKLLNGAVCPGFKIVYFHDVLIGWN